MIFWATPYFIIRLFKSLIWHGDRNKRVIHLTFDDGPTPEITQWVIDLLGKYDAKATFFCLGRNVERHEDIYNQILAAGHQVGNHSYSHLKGWKTSVKTYIQDVNLASLHIQSTLFRPPYGRIQRLQAKYLSKTFRIIMWDVLSHDYNRKLPARMCFRNVVRHTRNGSIVVFHDSEKAWKNLSYVLPLFLEHFKNKGYHFDNNF